MIRKMKLVLMVCIMTVSAIVVYGQSAHAEAQDQTFRLGVEDLPTSSRPWEAISNTEKTLSKALYEGLVRLDRQGNVVSGMAQSWVVSEDGKTYTFTLRPDARWSNNEPLKAADFVNAWKQVMKPEEFAPYGFLMEGLVNAKAYRQGKIKDFTHVGVKALDDATLQVKLTQKTSYFLKQLAEPVYDPVYTASIHKASEKAYAAGTLVSNGPFMQTGHTDNTITLVPNPYYYNAKSVRLKQVQFIATSDPITAYNRNQIDWTGGSYSSEKMYPQFRLHPDFMDYYSRSTYYYQFNFDKKPFNNLKIRQALAMSIQRYDLGYGMPAYGFVAPGIHGIEQDYRYEVNDHAYFKENLNKARTLLKQGLAEEKLKKLPTVIITLNEGSSHTTVARSIVRDWQQNLGISAKYVVQPLNKYSLTRSNGDFQLYRDGWSGDYNDPAAFLNYFTSGSLENNSGWSSKTYDQYIQKARQTDNNTTRNQLYHKAEKLLIDQMVLLPIYYYQNYFISRSNLQDAYIDYNDNLILNEAYFKQN